MRIVEIRAAIVDKKITTQIKTKGFTDDIFSQLALLGLLENTKIAINDRIKKLSAYSARI